MTKEHNAISHSIFRRPCWRWDFAQQLHAKGARFNYRDDRWVAAARKYLAHCDKVLAKKRVRNSKEINLVRGALAIQEGPAERRWLAEAAILASETPEQVAARCDAPVATIEAFEALFFDVRPWLGYRDWITARVFDGLRPERLREGYPGSVAKLFAYRGGPLVLDAVHAVVSGGPFPAWCEHNAASDDAQLRVSVELAMRMTAAVYPAEIAELCRLKHLAAKPGASDISAAVRKLWRMLGKAKNPKSKKKAARPKPTAATAVCDV